MEIFHRAVTNKREWKTVSCGVFALNLRHINQLVTWLQFGNFVDFFYFLFCFFWTEELAGILPGQLRS